MLVHICMQHTHMHAQACNDIPMLTYMQRKIAIIRRPDEGKDVLCAHWEGPGGASIKDLVRTNKCYP